MSQDPLRVKKVINDTLYLIKEYDVYGRIYVEETYVNDVKLKSVAYHVDGSIYYEDNYSKKGERIIKKSFYSDNKISTDYIYYEDSTIQEIYYYENGIIRAIGKLKCNSMPMIDDTYCGHVGLWRYYHKSGTIFLIGAYLPEYDMVENYSKDKNIIETFERPKKHGIWIEFDEDGNYKKHNCYEFGVLVNCN
jgi:antitoxin component YwqK of YwqJK toxin-antitoxin module